MTNSSLQFDVAVIGASLAGSTAATVLGRSGLRVLLVDKARFPRRKPCGEGLSSAGLRIARRHGLWIDSAPPGPFLQYDGFRLCAGSRWHDLRMLDAGGITIEREYIDAHWLQTAKRVSTVTVREESEASPFVGNGSCGITIGDQRYTSRYLILADGSNSAGARTLGIPSLRSGGGRMGASIHFQGRYTTPPSRVCIAVDRNYELYGTPLPSGKLNLAVLSGTTSEVNLRRVLLNRALRSELFHIMSFEGEPIDTPLGCSPIGHLRRRSQFSNVLLVGDAAEEFDPIGGMGMTHALLSAELAASHILHVERGNIPAAQLSAQYDTVRLQSAVSYRRFTNLSYRMLRAAHHFPPLLGLATSRLGRAVVQRLAA